MTVSIRPEKRSYFIPAGVISDWISNMNAKTFFLYIFLYHLLVVFQGLDFNDEGFHLAFYQQIFSDPESVQYAFWGWLSGILGGLFMKFLPFLGIWGIRFLGAVVSTCTIILAYNILKEYLGKVSLIVGMVMLSLFINDDAKNLYYNNLSGFLYLVTVHFVFRGLKSNKNWAIVVGGVFVGLNIFSRIPNILGLALIVSIFYFGYLKNWSLKEFLSKSFLFFAGVIASCIAVLLIMISLHHLEYFIGSIQMIFSPSRGAKDDGLNGAYGFSRLITSNLIDYARSVRFVIALAFIALAIGFVNNAVRNSDNRIRNSIRILNYLICLGAFALIGAGWFTPFRLMEFFVGASLLSTIVLFQKNASDEFKLLTVLGVLITGIHPFGSSEGISTVVVYSMWLSFPIALDYAARLGWINLDLRISIPRGSSSIHAQASSNQLRLMRLLIISVISVACLYNVIRYPYLCDNHSRGEMMYSVDNKFMHGIFTSRARVNTLNELLQASARFVKPNDTVLAYDCMPMYHFMTQTRSYVRNPCIWFYTTDMFRKELDLAQIRKKDLPVIVRQLIKTTGDGNGWPETRPAADYLQLARTQGKNNILNDFINKHHYSQAWTNGDFVILIPPK